jgi:hypothetical protein
MLMADLLVRPTSIQKLADSHTLTSLA